MWGCGGAKLEEVSHKVSSLLKTPRATEINKYSIRTEPKTVIKLYSCGTSLNTSDKVLNTSQYIAIIISSISIVS